MLKVGTELPDSEMRILARSRNFCGIRSYHKILQAHHIMVSQKYRSSPLAKPLFGSESTERPIKMCLHCTLHAPHERLPFSA
jgi:hypothetical protein